MTSDNRDLQFLDEALPQLQEYLLSNELYWPLNASLPRLTPGALLLTLARAQSAQHERQFEAIRARWRAAWEKKAAREIANRLRLWSAYLSDHSQSPDRQGDNYAVEVRNRVILTLLLVETPDPQTATALQDLDGTLRRVLRPGAFIWDAAFQPVFPQSTFWFLYGTL